MPTKKKPTAKPRRRVREYATPGEFAESLKAIAPAVSMYLNGIADRARYRLIEISDISRVSMDEGTYRYTKAFLCPAHLGHVKVFPDFVRLITADNNYIDITNTEWDRIKPHFGYQATTSPLGFDSIIPEALKTE